MAMETMETMETMTHDPIATPRWASCRCRIPSSFAPTRRHWRFPPVNKAIEHGNLELIYPEKNGDFPSLNVYQRVGHY